MDYRDKTKEQLIHNVVELRQRITELVKDNNELRNIKENLYFSNRVLEASPELISVVGLDYIYRYVNRSYMNAHGLSTEQILGMHVADLLGKEAFDSLVKPNLDKCFAGEEIKYESWFTFKNTGRHYMAVSYLPLITSSGSIDSLVVISRDITEQKKAEKELEDIFNLSPDMMCVSTIEGTIVKVNHAWEQTLGYTSDEVLELGWEKLIHPDDVALVHKEIDRQMNGKAILAFRNRYRCKDGTYRTLEWNALPSENRVLYATARDITERKKAEETLKQIMTAVESTSDAIGISDPEGHHFYQNRAFSNLLEYATADELEAAGGGPAAIKDDSIAKEIFDTIMSGKSWIGELEMVTKSGRVFPAFERADAIKDDEGNIIGLIGIITDITDRRRLEEELQRSQKLESIGILAGGIAHDFNNLLFGILNYVHLLKPHVGQANDVYEYLEQTEKGIKRAASLTQQLLTFSQGGTPVRKAASIVEIIKESSDFILRGSNVKCEYSVADNIMPVEVDAGQMNQVISNLVMNADQAMHEGGIINVRVENYSHGKDIALPLGQGMYVRVSIQDHGPGIAQEHLQKIFDPYFSTKKIGQGLGLAITYSIIRKHDGLLTVDSKLGAGTTFTIYLPASGKKAIAQEIVEHESAEGVGKILLMEDEAIILISFKKLLERAGYEAETAMDGHEAIELYRHAYESSRPFDAVILDLTVPGGIGGKEVIKEMLKIDPAVKAIVSSGYSNDPVMANYKDYGFRDVFIKGINDSDDICRILNRIMKSNR